MGTWSFCRGSIIELSIHHQYLGIWPERARRSEARGRGMWRCNYQLIWPKQVTVRGWGGVVRRIVLLLVVSSVGLFLSYQ